MKFAIPLWMAHVPIHSTLFYSFSGQKMIFWFFKLFPADNLVVWRELSIKPSVSLNFSSSLQSFQWCVQKIRLLSVRLTMFRGSTALLLRSLENNLQPTWQLQFQHQRSCSPAKTPKKQFQGAENKIQKDFIPFFPSRTLTVSLVSNVGVVSKYYPL